MMRIQTTMVLAGILATAASVASAELRVCNDTSYIQAISVGYNNGNIQAISVGYNNGNNFVSEGWWNIDPGSCATPIQGDLQTRYYYYRAEIDGGKFNGEDYMFCTSTVEYTIVGDKNCGGRGYDRESFREIDTGANHTSYTLTLVP